MKEVIADAVHDGDSLVIDGFTHLVCFAAGHEIIRQGRRHLTAVRLTPDLVYDQLVEAGCVDKWVFSWAGNPGVGSLHAIRRRTEASSKERLALEAYSHVGLLARFMAGSAGLPFWPIDNYAGSSVPGANPSIKTVRCRVARGVLDFGDDGEAALVELCRCSICEYRSKVVRPSCLTSINLVELWPLHIVDAWLMDTIC